MYDFDDSLIREMVQQCHVPTEVVITSQEGTVVRDVVCDKDQSPWPCEAISGFRAWTAAQSA